MPQFQLRPVAVADSQSISINNMSAFYELPPWRLLWGPHLLPDIIKSCEARFPTNFIKDRAHRRHEKVIDSETGEVAGYARWILPSGYENEWLNTQAEMPTKEDQERYQKAFDSVFWYPDSANEFDFKDVPLRASKAKAAKGEQYISLDYLAVNPAHKGKGVGTMLVQSGCKVADTLGLRIAVICTPGGWGVYKKAGFDLFETIVQDDSHLGGDGKYTMMIATREPNTQIPM